MIFGCSSRSADCATRVWLVVTDGLANCHFKIVFLFVDIFLNAVQCIAVYEMVDGDVEAVFIVSMDGQNIGVCGQVLVQGAAIFARGSHRFVSIVEPDLDIAMVVHPLVVLGYNLVESARVFLFKSKRNISLKIVGMNEKVIHKLNSSGGKLGWGRNHRDTCFDGFLSVFRSHAV